MFLKLFLISSIVAAASAKPGYIAPVPVVHAPVVAAVPAPLPPAVSHSTFVRHPSPVFVKHAPLVSVPVVHPVAPVHPIHPIAPAPILLKTPPLVPIHHPAPLIVKTVPVVPAVHPAPLFVKPHLVPAVHPAPLILH